MAPIHTAPSCSPFKAHFIVCYKKTQQNLAPLVSIHKLASVLVFLFNGDLKSEAENISLIHANLEKTLHMD